MNSPRLICLHGWSMSRDVFGPLAQALPGVSLHGLDLPGHGGRRPVPGEEVLWLEDIAGQLPETDGPLTLVGWSLGAMLALELARSRPQRIARLILVGATPRFLQAGDWQAGQAAAQLKLLRRNLERDDRKALGAFWMQMFAANELTPAALRSLARQTAGAERLPSRAGALAGLELLAEIDLRQHCADLEIPTLLIHGSEDRIVPPAAAQWLAEALPSARLEILPGLGHAPHLSCPGEVAALIRGFVA